MTNILKKTIDGWVENIEERNDGYVCDGHSKGLVGTHYQELNNHYLFYSFSSGIGSPKVKNIGIIDSYKCNNPKKVCYDLLMKMLKENKSEKELNKSLEEIVMRSNAL